MKFSNLLSPVKINKVVSLIVAITFIFSNIALADISKTSALAPYLLTAARINKIEEISDRTEADLKAWAGMNIKLWLPAAMANLAKMHIVATRELLAIRFNSDVDNAVEKYITDNGLGQKEAAAFKTAAKDVKRLAAKIITDEINLSLPGGADIITEAVDLEKAVNNIEDGMNKRKVNTVFDSAISGDRKAYDAIVALPKEKLIAYLESNLNDTIKGLSEDIFGFGKGYDVRGNAQPVEGGAVNLSPDNLYLIGKLLGTHYADAGDKALITGDIRLHTPILRYVMALGLASVGINVDYAPDYMTTGAHNLLSTENEGNYRLMVQVSGSHGIPAKNGFKIKACLNNKRDGLGRMMLDPLYAEPLEGLYWKDKTARKRQTELRAVAKAGDVKEIAGLEQKVIEMLSKTLPAITKDEIVVIDPRAGAAGPITTGVLKNRGFEIIDMDTMLDDAAIQEMRKGQFELTGPQGKKLMDEIGGLWANGKHRIAVMLNKTPDGNMGRGIWDPSKPEALIPAKALVKFINGNIEGGMPKAIGSVFDCDTDRITGILEDGADVPAFEMTLPYYQRFLLDESNQDVIMKIVKAGGKPIQIVCDVRANSKLLGLVDSVNKSLQQRTGLTNKNFVEGWLITTGYPPQLGFMQNRIAELDSFVSADQGLSSDKEFIKKFEHLKATYFTAEASGHNFFHISERYPNRVCDCAISGLITLLNIKETMTPAEVPAGRSPGQLTDLFANFPIAYSSNEIRVSIPNSIKVETATAVGMWMKEKYKVELKPYSEPIVEGDYMKQPKDAGFVVVSGFKVQLVDGRAALVRWSNTGEELTTIFEGPNWAGLVGIIREITERLRQETGKGVNVANLDKEIARLEAIQKNTLSGANHAANEKQNAINIGRKLHAPLAAATPEMAKRFLEGGYRQSGYGVAPGASIDGSFAIGNEGDQGYYVDKTNVTTPDGKAMSGKDVFLSTVRDMREFFERRERILGEPIKYVIKPGIGGQHTPFQGVADVFHVIDITTGRVVGEYELGKNYETALSSVMEDVLRVRWDQIAVIPSSKSGSTDETMMIFTDIFRVLLKKIAEREGLRGELFADTVFQTMHEVNFVQGKERPGKDLFKGFNMELVRANLEKNGVKAITYERVKRIFSIVLGNMFFETTDRPGQSRLSAFIRNSGLDKELGENKPGFGAMFDNVGGRWTADLHMMTFLAYHKLNAEEYWNTRYAGIKSVREGKHVGSKLGNKILDENITDIAILVPDDLFWFGKSIEQNFNESIWQKGFANLIAIKESDWEAQKRYYAAKPNRLVINISGLDIKTAPVNVYNLVDLQVPDFAALNKQKLANSLGELFATFYGMTHTVGNRLISRALAEKGFTAADVDLNDLDNPATRIVQQNLYVRQPYVELGKGLLENKLKALQEKGRAAIEEELERIKASARKREVISNVSELDIPKNIAGVEELAGVIKRAAEFAKKTGRKFVPFIYLEGYKFQELRGQLVKLGVEWVMQGTGDQHISYQQVLAQPQKYLPFIISFVPKETLPGQPAVGFAKGYLDNVSSNMVRDLFAEASYKALTEPRTNEAGEAVNGAAGIFLRMTDEEKDRSVLSKAFATALSARDSAEAPSVKSGPYEGLTETEQAFANAGLKALVEEKLSKSQGDGKISYETVNEIMKDAVGLSSTVSSISAPETQRKIILLGYDNSLDPASNAAARESEDKANEYLNNSLVEVRASGKELSRRMQEEKIKLQEQYPAETIVVMTITGDITLKQLNTSERGNLGKVLDIMNFVSATEIRPVPVMGLYDLVLRIAYGQDIERDILPCLNRIAFNGNNQPFTKSDIERLLSEGLLRLIPKAGPVNASEAAERYKASQAVARAL